MNDTEDMAECPYNKNHRFAASKLFWHLGRCKDKLKTQHLYKKCKYNPIHIHLISDIKTHQLICKDKTDHESLINELKNSLRQCKAEDRMNRTQRSRSRSQEKREIIKQQEILAKQEKEEMGQNYMQNIFEQCLICQKNYKMFLQSNKDPNHKIIRLVKKYNSIKA